MKTPFLLRLLPMSQKNPLCSTLHRLRLRRLMGVMLLSGLVNSGLVMAEASRLIVEVHTLRDGSGDVRASIYREAETFRKEHQAVQIVSLPAQPGTVTLSFDGLAPGRYALMVYHDANADQKLNLRFGMFPTEGYGLSNNPKVLGPPKFEDSAFNVEAPETRISVKLTD